MGTSAVQIPPLRTNLNDPNLTDQTAKEWYLFWKNSGDQITALTGMLTYGTHADRPDASVAKEGAVYLESDRGNVVYVSHDGKWYYVAGTMWGTLSPDQRPTDLGPTDAGFDFRGTDQQREFIWSGTVWVEVTPPSILYGTHANRLAATVADLLPGSLWMETDRDNVVYQVQVVSGSPAWVYVTGIMAGALSGLPTDLGANDVEFLYATSDTLEHYRWSGSAWVNQTPANVQQIAYSAVVTTLTTTPQDVGVSITLARAGRYALTGVFDFRPSGAGDINALLLGQVVYDGVADPKEALKGVTAAVGDAATVGQQWTYTAPAVGKIVKLQAWKTAGTGASFTAGHCSLSAVWMGP